MCVGLCVYMCVWQLSGGLLTHHAHVSSQQARPQRGTQPQHNAGLHAQRLAKPTSSHAQHRAATTTTITTTTTKLQRQHPREHHPPRQQRGRHHDQKAPRNPLIPANEARVLKHDNARSAFKRTSAAETAQHTPPTHAGASSPCPSSSPARRPNDRKPKPPNKQLIKSITTTASTAVTTTTHTPTRRIIIANLRTTHAD